MAIRNCAADECTATVFAAKDSFRSENRAVGACSKGAEHDRPQSEATSKSMPNERRKNMVDASRPFLRLTNRKHKCFLLASPCELLHIFPHGG